jgi:hypothetical protein
MRQPVHQNDSSLKEPPTQPGSPGSQGEGMIDAACL